LAILWKMIIRLMFSMRKDKGKILFFKRIFLYIVYKKNINL